jgi:hypothetical protein
VLSNLVLLSTLFSLCIAQFLELSFGFAYTTFGLEGVPLVVHAGLEM